MPKRRKISSIHGRDKFKSSLLFVNEGMGLVESSILTGEAPIVNGWVCSESCVEELKHTELSILGVLGERGIDNDEVVLGEFKLLHDKLRAMLGVDGRDLGE